MKKTTTLDYIILGLVQPQPLSGYRIRKTFEDTALGNFGGSPGTIYPALNRLEQNGLIEKQSAGNGAKSVFSITTLGLGHLKNWLEQDPSMEEVKKNPELLVLKFAFMDPLVTHQQKLAYLKNMKDQLEAYLQVLENYFTEEKLHMPQSGKLAFEHGLMTYKTNIHWCLSAIDALRDKGQDTRSQRTSGRSI